MLEKYNKIWDRVINSIKTGFDSEPVCNEKYLKTKTKSYEGKISTNFHEEGIPKERSHCIFLAAILIDPVFKTSKSDYTQVPFRRM